MKSLPAFVLFAASVGACSVATPTKAPATVGSPPDEVAALRAELDKANKLAAMLQESLGQACPGGSRPHCLTAEGAIVDPPAKSNCAGGICPVCKCDPTDAAKCVDGQCKLPADDLPPAANPGRWELRTFRSGWRGRQTSQQWVWVSPITTQGATTYRGGCASCR